jgi:AcrR family transcriptional regulator
MRSDIGGSKPATRIRLKPDERRRLIVEAAFKAVAQEGFEGLRTRDIAESIGINSATLHHYFPSKQDLIDAIAEHLEHRLRTEHAPAPDGAPGLADLFGRQFDDLAFYHTEVPEVLAVFREFVARAPRDAAICALVDKLHTGWYASIVTALTQARRQGLLREDIDLEAAARIVLSTAWGLVARIYVSMPELQATADQLRMLMSPAKPAHLE